MRFWYERKAGYVALPGGKSKTDVLAKEETATLSKRRLCCTLMAFVSDDKEVQRLLPQVLLVNKRALKAAEEKAVAQFLRDSGTLFLWQQDSAWASVDTMCKVLRLLGERLAPVKPLAHCLLSMDCAPIHLPPRTAAAAARAGVFLHYVPANMTSHLAPLDVYVFGSLKKEFRDALEETSMHSPTGTYSNMDVVIQVFKVVQRVVQGRDWRHAFLRCGWGDKQRQVGLRLSRSLDSTPATLAVSNDIPSLADLQLVFPKKTILPIGWLFHLVAPTPLPPGAESELGQPADSGDEEHALVWAGRLRSSSSRAPPESSSPPLAIAQPPLQCPPVQRPAQPVVMPLAPPKAAAAMASLSRPSSATPGLRGLPVGRPLFRSRSREDLGGR